MTTESTKRSYFVDEAGDDTLFSENGAYYIQKKPLTIAALDNDSPGI